MFRHKKKGYLVLLVAIAVLLATVTGFVGARYIRRSKIEAQIHSSDFHVSSNYLEYIGDAKPETTVTGWSKNGIWVDLYTYEKTNVAQINPAGMDIKFTVEIKDDKGGSLENNAWELTYYDASGIDTDIVESGDEPTETTLTSRGTKDIYGFNLKYVGSEAPTYVDFTININSPYEFPLTGRFDLTGKTGVESTVIDMGDYDKLIIKSNDYSGTVGVTWPTGDSKCVVPDNMNELMADWANGSASSSSGSFTIGSHETVTLIFGEKLIRNYSKDDFAVSTVFTTAGGNS